MSRPVQGFDDALGRAIVAANEAHSFRIEAGRLYERAAADRDGGAYHRSIAEELDRRSPVAAAEAQAWAAIAQAMTTRNREMLGAGL